MDGERAGTAGDAGSTLETRTTFELPSYEPEEKHTEDGPAGVDEDVRDQGGAGGDEDLMDFIGGGVEEDDEDCDEGFAPAPGAGIVRARFPNGAPEEHPEDGIFGEVRAFANGVMDGFDVVLSHVGEKPVQKRFDQAGGMAVGTGIA
jgi:hypothetical protein